MKQISQNNLQTPGAQVAALQAIIKAQQQQLDVYQRLLERKSKGKPKAVIVGKFKITSQEILKMPTVSKTKNEFAVHDIIIRCRQLPGGMLQARMNRKGIVLDVKGRTPLELRTRFVKAFEDALAQQAIDDAMVALSLIHI